MINKRNKIFLLIERLLQVSDSDRRSKKYLKGFTIVGVFFFLIVLLPVIPRLGLWRGILLDLIVTILWTIMMAIIFIPLDYLSTRKMPPEALRTHQTRKFKITGDLDRVFNNSLMVLKNFKYIKQINPIKKEQKILARTKKSIYSYGEEITLRFEIINNETAINVFINSQPAFPALLDFGKNFKNVEYLSKQIKKSCEI